MAAIAWTWPVARHLSWRLPHDPGDPVLNTWILWWNAQALPFTDAWWSPPIFYPMTGALALSEHLLGVSMLTTPLQLVGVSALTAYNIALILSFALSGYFMFLLVRYLVGQAGSGIAGGEIGGLPAPVVTAAAVVAGAAYAFAPYRASQLAHLQVLQSQWMPLALLAMHAYLDSGRRRWLAVFAGAWLLQALSNGYYLLFFPVLIVMWMAWFVDWRRAPRRGVHLAATWIGSSILLLPALLEYSHVQSSLGLARTLGEMLNFSGDWAAFMRRSHLLAFFPRLDSPNQETFLYPGLVAVLLVAKGACPHFVHGRSKLGTGPLFFYGTAALGMWWLAFGPAAAGSGLGVVGFPYSLLTYLPGFSGLRVPARFAMLGYMCLSVAAGLAFARLAPARVAPLGLFTVLTLTALGVDGWPRAIPLIPPPGRVLLPEVAGAAVLELPVDDDRTSTAALYRSMQHGHPLINGYSGYSPPHYRILAHSLRSGDPSVITELARLRPLIIAVNVNRGRDAQFIDVVESVPGVQMRSATNLGPVFVLSQQPAVKIPPPGERFAFTAQAEGRNGAVLDLGREAVVRRLSFPLRGNHRDFGTRFQIDGSTDGLTWTSLWLDWTGGLALAGALEDPLEVPVRFVLPDVRVRYLRIHPAPDWMVKDLEVHGPR